MVGEYVEGGDGVCRRAMKGQGPGLECVFESFKRNFQYWGR